jgi:hypothetical protein
MTDAREERCAELRPVLLGLTPLMIEMQGNPAKLPELRPHLTALRAIAAQGSAGIDVPAYAQWVSTANESVTVIEQAIDRGDAKAAWAAITDQRTGINLLGQACAGCPGW